MTSRAKHIRNSQWWLVGLVLVAMCIIIGIFSSSQTCSSDPNDILRDNIAREIKGNTSKLSSAVLVWHLERKYFGPWSSKPQSIGDHQLWWDGKRTAIFYKMNTTVNDPNGQSSTSTKTKFMAYNGKDFRVAEFPTTPTGTVEVAILKKPGYRMDENYLQDVGWLGHGLLGCALTKPTASGTQSHSTEENLIKLTFHNSKTGQIGLWVYDTEKSCVLVTYENYAKKDMLQSRTTIQYKHISGGVWFPISVVADSFNIQNGELIGRSKMQVDVDKSSFNNPSAIPKDAFELKTGPNAQVEDMTSLKTRLKLWLNNL